ncbi:Glycosyltransferase involved in cell wall bisynthesis [Parapedobacter luteus]|uniref:Glycosyltransferase involved in cell wall bisynthesis n=1 Tax=Parapedobacter luteus TaxID=623280 RepID=A0A1T5FQC6_9SPHI|nr:glycosyltransferase [Parapedobacter luteus]SKB98353.1 Glycosyltransferase involved in cell wall bisynthesis [Parapedobacter luteus]
MKISIIIPTYNRAHIIVETLNSVSNQTIKDWECIIIDDYSTDDTDTTVGEYLSQYPDLAFRYMKNERSKGAQGARNTGVDRAQGEFVMFLDSDDLLLPFCIEERLRIVEEHKGYDYYCFTTYALMPDGSVKSKYKLCSPDSDDIERFLKFQNPWHTMGCIITKDAVNTVGYWDEKFARSQDSEFYLRLVLQKNLRGYKACHLSYDSLFRSSYSQASVSRSSVLSNAIQDTYYTYLNKVRKQLNDLGLWAKYKESYVYFSFYIYSRFLMPKGKMEDRFFNIYVDLMDEIDVPAYKKEIYRLYFKHRGSKAVMNSRILRLFFKSIPKIFILPSSREMLW